MNFQHLLCPILLAPAGLLAAASDARFPEHQAMFDELALDGCLEAGCHRYRAERLPPVRALLLAFPADHALSGISNQFLFSDNPLAPPSGPATGPCNGLHPQSNFLALK